MKNTIPLQKNVRIMGPKGVCFFANVLWDRGLVEFQEFTTYALFMLKKWKSFGKNLSQRLARQTPSNLISMIRIIFSSGYEVNLTSKSLQSPLNDRKFCVIALKQNFVKKVGFIFVKITANSKAALGINKSGEIDKIHVRWKFSQGKPEQHFFATIRNQITACLQPLQLTHQNFLFVVRRTLNKFTIHNGFVSFFNEIWKNALDKFKRFFTSDDEMILRFVNFIFESKAGQTAKTPEALRKKVYNVLVGRRDDETALIAGRPGVRSNDFPYMKTSVPIGITGRVSKGEFVDHAVSIA